MIARRGKCPDCGGPLVFDSGLYHCDSGSANDGCGAWDRGSIWDWAWEELVEEDMRDEVLYAGWMERDPISQEIPDLSA